MDQEITAVRWDPRSKSYRWVHDAGFGLHSALARRPGMAQSWFRLLSLLRAAPAGPYKQRIVNSVASVRWPPLALPPQRVTLGAHTQVRIRPHPGEVDFWALVNASLDYEQPVFRWLEDHLPDYDTVVEVGANVGLFTTFMSAVKSARGISTPRLVAFEPSREAFSRLLDNLALNAADAETFNCAVGERSGVATLFEPEGHLTNGSLDASFARQFSPALQASQVLVVSAAELDELLPNPGRTLVKIDVEGAEALVLRGLRPVIERTRADVILEVLADYERTLREQDYLTALGYRFLRLEDAGPVEVAPYAASAQSRDHLLLAPRS